MGAGVVQSFEGWVGKGGGGGRKVQFFKDGSKCLFILKPFTLGIFQ